jgi:hypothetical protein
MKKVSFQYYTPWHHANYSNQPFVNDGNCIFNACGFLVNENNMEVTIALSYSKGTYSNQTSVPRQCIIDGSYVEL